MERIRSNAPLATAAVVAERPPRVLAVLAWLLDRVVARNERAAGGTMGRLTVFHGLRAPNISIDKYLERIFKYASCSPACFVVAYAYMDRFMRLQPDVPITSLNVHRLLITSVMAAAKFLDDAYYNNAYYAKVGGVTTQEMNRLELEFLFRLDFRLQITVNVFEAYCTHLERQVTCSVTMCQIQRPLVPILQPPPQPQSITACCAFREKHQPHQQYHRQQQQQQQVEQHHTSLMRYSYAS